MEDVTGGQITQTGVKKIESWATDAVPLAIPAPVIKTGKQVISGFLKAFFLDFNVSNALDILKKGRNYFEPSDLAQVSKQVKTKLESDTSARIAFAILPETECREAIGISIAEHYPELSLDLQKNLENEIYDTAMEKINENTAIYASKKGQELGQGSFSKVYKLNGEQLVMKVPKSLGDAGARKDIESEASIRAHLALAGGHENVAGITDVCADLSTIEPLASGMDGKKLLTILNDTAELEKKGLTPEDAKEIKILLLRDLTKGLLFMHQQGIAHLDVKPDNFLISSGGNGQVTDFGTCRFVGDQVKAIGTPLYMAPELIKGSSSLCSGKADVYSLGVVLGEMMTGEQPLRDVSGFNIPRHKEQGLPTFSFEQDGRLNTLTDNLFGWMVHPDPDQRPTIEQVNDELSKGPFNITAAQAARARANLQRLT